MNSGNDKPRKALGKGLSALLPAKPLTAAPAPAPAPERAPTDLADRSHSNRTRCSRAPSFSPDRLEELAALHSGEWHHSAARSSANRRCAIRSSPGNAGGGPRSWPVLTEVPVVVQEVADPQMLELALIENIQREDLNPIETAHAYDRLHRELGLSQEEIGRRTGKDRTSIANTLRLLKLPNEVQRPRGRTSAFDGTCQGTAGLAIAEDADSSSAEKAAAQGLSVRQVEALVQELTAGPAPDGKGSNAKEPQDPNVKAAAETTGTGPRHPRPDRRTQRAARTNRDRILLAGRSSTGCSSRSVGTRLRMELVPAAGVEPATYGL